MSAAIRYRSEDLELLARLEDRHFWFRARRRIIVDALKRWFPHAQSYLEIGAGTGYNARAVARAFPLWRIVATDGLAEGFPRVNALDIPFEAAFDVLAAYDVLEHIPDDRAALMQFRKACRPGGGILLTVPQHPWLWSAADRYAQHCRRYTRKGLLRLVRECGFNIVGQTSFHTFNLPALLARNALLRFRSYQPEHTAPLSPLNALLEAGMEIDRFLIGSGLGLPIGSSLLVTARTAD